MRIAMLGTRGVPARYGGFETAVEEIGHRLAARGHEVRVYCRGTDRAAAYRGIQRVLLPGIRVRSLETLSHTLVSAGHLRTHPTDVALVFNAANAPALPLLRRAGIPVAVHVDGLEWQRGKWGPTGRRYYRAVERLCVRWADALIADSRAIQDYYRAVHSAETTYLAYGAPLLTDPALHRLRDLGLAPAGYHLVVARLEPENNVELILQGYRGSRSALPLVIVGSVPYSGPYQQRLNALATRVGARTLGAVWDQELLDALYAGAATYLHGHSVGGTNPSLLRAIGAAAPVLAFDVAFNREVLNGHGLYFDDVASLAAAIREAEEAPELSRKRGRKAQEEARYRFTWDGVTDGYEALCYSLRFAAR